MVEEGIERNNLALVSKFSEVSHDFFFLLDDSTNREKLARGPSLVSYSFVAIEICTAGKHGGGEIMK